ncbi:hypothetical protein RO1_31670 [Roseburia intestinalis XB6B4]|uniref:Uncharacterized protein n=1 Tax=Roseburia intestinalis XB6B4 TaxID=718255 RepID=D4L1K8_9FIRM|nr:hypothetical protein RO1_31670 [Roseburia intestinalis XB6B4]
MCASCFMSGDCKNPVYRCFDQNPHFAPFCLT